MDLRYATIADLDILVELDAKCFDEEIAYDHAVFLEYMLKPGAMAPMIFRDGRLVAFAMAYMESDDVCHLVTVDVDEPCRRQGLGQQLMDLIQETYAEDGAGSIRLEVSAHNEAAKAFYDSNGYEIIDLYTNYYGLDHDAWIMEKTLRIS